MHCLHTGEENKHCLCLNGMYDLGRKKIKKAYEDTLEGQQVMTPTPKQAALVHCFEMQALDKQQMQEVFFELPLSA